VRSPRRLAFTIVLSAAAVTPACGRKSDDPPGAPDAGPPYLGDLDASRGECVNLCLQQINCVDSTTTLSGFVTDPAGKLPVYNAIVYVPNAPVLPFDASVSCDRCGAVSGSPLVSTLTDANGRFVLKQVPRGDDIPLVVQLGKWRRQLVVPKVLSCRNTPLGEIRLPRNHCEGDIPQIALTTGGDDALECWLRKVGIDDSEFTNDTGPGRVHLFAGGGATRATGFDASHGGQAFGAADALWADPKKLARYDLALFACEGETFPGTKPPSALDALRAFTAAGGRVLASHWQRYWWSTQGPQPSPFPPFATWTDRADPPGDVPSSVDITLPKNKAMRFWLEDPNVAAMDATGHLPLASARHNVDAVDVAKAMQWATFENPNAGGQVGVALLSSNMPSDAVQAQQCGRVTYADLHASPSDATGAPWPSGCTSQGMTAAEKALEFLLFDLASCITSDRAQPAPPQATTPPWRTRDDTAGVPPQEPITRGSCDPDGG
jgi:hypothetical protein